MQLDYSRPPDKNSLVTIRIIWAALLIGEIAFLLIILLFLWPAQRLGPPPAQSRPSSMLLYDIAWADLAISVLVGFFVRMMIFQKNRDEQGMIRRGSYVTGTIIFLAMLEGSGYLGLVNLMLSHALWPHILPPAIAMAIQVASFPMGMQVADSP